MFVGEEPEREVSDHEWLARVSSFEFVSSRLLLQCHTYRYDIEETSISNPGILIGKNSRICYRYLKLMLLTIFY